MRAILVFSAAGLIGQFVAAELIRRGFRVIAVARRFSSAQCDLFGDIAVQTGVTNCRLTRCGG